MKTSIIILVFIGIIIQSCRQKQADTLTITQRIQYDVTIKSPDADLNWWVQNIEGMNREAFVTEILQSALQGKINAYDAFLLNSLTPDQVRNIGRRSDTLSLQRSAPPYGYYDTIIRKELSIHDITRIRFLEEWELNKQNMKISKEILGIAPMLESYDENGNLRGFQPLFWVFFDKAYPEALKGNVLL